MCRTANDHKSLFKRLKLVASNKDPLTAMANLVQKEINKNRKILLQKISKLTKNVNVKPDGSLKHVEPSAKFKGNIKNYLPRLDFDNLLKHHDLFEVYYCRQSKIPSTTNTGDLRCQQPNCSVVTTSTASSNKGDPLLESSKKEDEHTEKPTTTSTVTEQFFGKMVNPSAIIKSPNDHIPNYTINYHRNSDLEQIQTENPNPLDTLPSKFSSLAVLKVENEYPHTTAATEIISPTVKQPSNNKSRRKISVDDVLKCMDEEILFDIQKLFDKESTSLQPNGFGYQANRMGDLYHQAL